MSMKRTVITLAMLTSPMQVGATPCYVGGDCPVPKVSAGLTIRRMTDLLLGGKVDPNEIAKAVYSKNLQAFIDKTDGDHWRDFDSEPLIGTQDWSDMKVGAISEIEDSAVQRTVAVTYISKTPPSTALVVRYFMINDHGAWKIDDITYSKPSVSLRYYLTREVEHEK